MSDSVPRKPVKIGVLQGGGPPPGYLWNIDILDAAFGESASILNQEQRDFIAEQFRELASHEDPTHSRTIDVRPIEDYFEFRDKGGILGRINIRVFFCVDKATRTIGRALESVFAQSKKPRRNAVSVTIG